MLRHRAREGRVDQSLFALSRRVLSHALRRPPEPAKHARRYDDQRKWNRKNENRDECRRRNAHQRKAFKGPLAYAHHRIQHNRQHRRLQAEE
jgi:hypothetical protein